MTAQPPHSVDTERVIIVGAGLGALYAALNLAPHPVLMISPDALGQGASSAWAQGGIAAAMAEADSPEAHAADTIRAGAGTVDADVAAFVTAEARAHILDLTAIGTPFDRDAQGGYVLSREAAHGLARVVRVQGDQAGREIMAALIAEVRRTPSVQVIEGVVATDLSTSDGKITGVVIEATDGSGPIRLRGTAVLLAGGGSGGLYALTTNPPRIRGQAIGMAARAGAVMSDAEFVQFHPTAIDMGEDPAPLATEALRGEGATLINRDGTRFMLNIHPDAELAPRDVVARAIFAETQAGRRPMLDTRTAIGAEITHRFPAVAEACRRGGIDPVTQAIPVAAAAHYHMGGIAVSAQGRSSLSGLWACGEASATGLHGANRLASNGLLEALVYGRRAARDIAKGLDRSDAPPVTLTLPNGGLPPDPALVASLRQTMTEHVGVVRDAAGLKTALCHIAALEAQAKGNPGFLNMTATATLIAAAALLRQESRGAQCRRDFPDTNPALAHRSTLTLTQALALRQSVTETSA
ncbi:L-aspartate oxidase [Cypionkella aquatica]|uniref:L-aspartate oxidase n=1 Tax=Cypionkella aquatica TaxID=1756042 RepID=A0AA37TW22_9RHOB|nr:L-aspartate oxidase [Cypionkella aquatica]GLS88618.1 L-aspartate oxidase [Cypionkella aquatica]GLS88672.1 L-aspartate oxidase [Cypionkella aquatica]